MERFVTHKILEVLCARPITQFCAVATIYRSFVQIQDRRLFKFQFLRSCLTGGEAMNDEVISKWKSLLERENAFLICKIICKFIRQTIYIFFSVRSS